MKINIQFTVKQFALFTCYNASYIEMMYEMLHKILTKLFCWWTQYTQNCIKSFLEVAIHEYLGGRNVKELFLGLHRTK